MSVRTQINRLAAASTMVLGLAVGTGAAAGVVPVTGWTAWAVGGAGTSTTVGGGGDISFKVVIDPAFSWSNDVAGNYATAGTNTQHGGKAFYSTDTMNGRTVGELDSLSYTCTVFCVDNAGPGGPYVNVFVVDPSNAANKAILLVLYNGAGNVHNDFDFDTVDYRVNETTNPAWIGANGTDLSFAAVKNLKIGSGAYLGMVQPVGGFSGPGADDGLLIAWGNRGGAPNLYQDVTINGLSVTSVPEPGSLALAGLALVGLAAARRRKIA